MKIFLAIVLLAIAQLAPAAEPIGRIFYTPEQRAELDSLRSRRVVATQVRNEPTPEFVTYNGIVRRSDGKATVWVNGESLSEAELRDKQSIIGRIDRSGQILLQTPQAKSSGQLRLKVGQSAELLSGRIDESYAFPGTITAPADKPKSESESKPAAPSENKAETKDIPPELLEALREAARKSSGANATVESAKPATRP